MACSVCFKLPHWHLVDTHCVWDWGSEPMLSELTGGKRAETGSTGLMVLGTHREQVGCKWGPCSGTQRRN